MPCHRRAAKSRPASDATPWSASTRSSWPGVPPAMASGCCSRPASQSSTRCHPAGRSRADAPGQQTMVPAEAWDAPPHGVSPRAVRITTPRPEAIPSRHNCTCSHRPMACKVEGCPVTTVVRPGSNTELTGRSTVDQRAHWSPSFADSTRRRAVPVPQRMTGPSVGTPSRPKRSTESARAARARRPGVGARSSSRAVIRSASSRIRRPWRRDAARCWNPMTATTATETRLNNRKYHRPVTTAMTTPMTRGPAAMMAWSTAFGRAGSGPGSTTGSGIDRMGDRGSGRSRTRRKVELPAV
ncbi:hypothetical protein ACFFX0_24400 [Citricoccus parietis]|uniref:Uncharacterized protein n=1 Tax=Citricoccus parietis TaxID=592307 RepID=A0ABV5G5D3_9MICC